VRIFAGLRRQEPEQAPVRWTAPEREAVHRAAPEREAQARLTKTHAEWVFIYAEINSGEFPV
jgi:hypothetical protein